MLTDDNGHPMITTAKKGRLRSIFFTIKPITLVGFRVILNRRVRLTKPITIIVHYYICVGRIIRG